MAEPLDPETAGAQRVAFMALVAGAVCIAFAPIFVRFSELGPSATGFQRMLLSLPFFWFWSRKEREGEGREDRAGSWPTAWVVFSGLAFAGDLGVWHWSIKYTTVAHATLLANFAPVLVTLATWLFFSEPVRREFVAGMALALAGAVCLVGASFEFGGTRLFGDLLGLLTAFFYAAYIVAVKEARRSLGPAELLLVSSLVSCLGLGAMAVASGEALWPATGRGFLAVAGLALVSQVAGQGLIAWGLAALPASFSSVTLLVQPAGATILAWLLFDEALTPLQGIGALAILAGIFVARRAALGKPA